MYAIINHHEPRSIEMLLTAITEYNDAVAAYREFNRRHAAFRSTNDGTAENTQTFKHCADYVPELQSAIDAFAASAGLSYSAANIMTCQAAK